MAVRVTTAEVSSQTTGATVPVDYLSVPFVVGLAVEFSTAGTLTYKVQYTLDNIFDPLVTPVWFDHSTITGKTANFSDSLTVPATAVRLNVTAYTSGGVKLHVLQGDDN